MQAAQAIMQQEQPKFVKPKGDERQRLVTQRTALVLHSPFFGLLSIRLKLVEAPWIVTAGVDGKHLFYNPSYIAGLSDPELKGLWAHEVLHCTNGHVWRRGQRGKERWNWACDFAIDPILVNAGFKVPNATINPAWAGWSAEQIYPHIPEKPGKKDGEQGEGSGSGQGQGQGDPRAPNYAPTKGEVLDGDEASANQQQAEWKQAVASVAQVAKSQGKLPAGLELLIDQWLKPRVPWRSILRKFVQLQAAQDYSWSVRNRRYGNRRTFMPGLRSEHMPPIVLGVDTSGSIGAEELAQFKAEIASIIDEVRPEVTHVVFCDARVEGVQEFRPGDEFKFKARGGGGTSFAPVFDWVEENNIEPACLIYLTDMYGSFPTVEPEYPVLWASTSDPDTLRDSYKPPFGELLHLDFQTERRAS